MTSLIIMLLNVVMKITMLLIFFLMILCIVLLSKEKNLKNNIDKWKELEEKEKNDYDLNLINKKITNLKDKLENNEEDDDPIKRF